MSRFNDEQIRAIEWFDGPCLVLGTPGSGKTTVIVNRIKYLICERQIAPQTILVITFTKAAAVSMQERFISLMGKTGNDKLIAAARKVRFGTFHSIFYWIIKTAYNYEASSVLSEDERKEIIKKEIDNMHLEYENKEDIVSSVIRQIEVMNCDMIDINDYYSKDMPAETFRNLYHRYQDRKRRLGKIDFDDMLNMCYELLTERPDILNAIRKMYPYIMVDEFQDTNLIQYELLKLLASPLNNLFVVGDDDQSIYAFRGARPEIMLGFKKEFKGAEIITLSINYRCPRLVTSCSSRLIGNNKRRYEKDLKSSGNSGKVYIDHIDNVEKECMLVVNRIREKYAEGVPYKDMAVLYRTNLNPRRLIFKLREYNIPFILNDAMPNIFNHFSVQVILSYIQFALGNNSRKLFLDFMNKPVRYIRRDMLDSEEVDINALIVKAKKEGKDYLQSNLSRLKINLAALTRMKPEEACNYIRKNVDYDGYLRDYAKERNIDKADIFEALDEFCDIVREFDSYEEMFNYIEEYAEMLYNQARKAKQYNLESSDAIKLMTLHSSKGLEFREVHIIECVEDIIPHKKSNTDQLLEEERRMFYVGMTRAGENLYMYAPRNMSEKRLKPTRFFDELRPPKN